MEKQVKDMTAEEYGEYIHSDKNLNGHIQLDKKQIEEIIPSARHLAYFSDLSNHGRDILQMMEMILATIDVPEDRYSQLQAVEWICSQMVKDASELLKHISTIQEYIHGAHGSNMTLCELLQEKREKEQSEKTK